ncbi:MBOAT family protein [Paenibacillus sp. J2TS4]|uniref:MBOAT family O-acyltransferase n=1 Tax=Paenibacillus sp. J2TS4 TaxID=2807194 RepID=UPI001B2EDE4E|nr:MBOAT family O-acyltransferase [Paenibacillus sp. J2TS4]GIP31569.1 alginate O-acetylation protein [Paenibacillus sp. J2TS4]
MIFSSYSFIFVFLPVTLFVYRLLVIWRRYSSAKLWLVAASLYFYAQGSSEFVLWFVAAILFNYALGGRIRRLDGSDKKSRRSKRILLAVGLAQNLALLGYYKYTNFFIENLNALTGQSLTLKSIVLPLGISFFTFQLIAYLVDCYRGRVEEHSVIDYLVFITFFPQLIVGPIVHHGDIIPQLNQHRQAFFNKADVMLGLYLFSIGCAKKLVLADPLTAYAEAFLADLPGADPLTGWTAVVSYTLSYYFDLSGYADMAIGLGWLFGIRLPHNFDSPYKARNFREYWQKWHMTLSRFLGDYIFRSIYRKGAGSGRFYSAVLVTFLVSGIWHGAGWHFVLWGLINGIFVCAAHYMTRNKLRLPFLLAWAMTFAGIVGTRILFVSSGAAQSVEVFRKLFNIQEVLDAADWGMRLASFIAFNLYPILLLIISLGIALFVKNTREMTENFVPSRKHAIWAAFLLVLALFHMTEVSDFLYFQF